MNIRDDRPEDKLKGMKGMSLRTSVLAVVVTSFALGGCAPWRNKGLVALARPVKGDVLTAERLTDLAKPESGRAYRVRRVAETAGARVFTLQTTGEVQPYRLKKHDQIFFVVSGAGIAAVNVGRRVIGPGSVVVVPRGDEVRFVRDEAHGQTPLTLVQVVVPGGDITREAQKALEKPKRKPKKPKAD